MYYKPFYTNVCNYLGKSTKFKPSLFWKWNTGMQFVLSWPESLLLHRGLEKNPSPKSNLFCHPFRGVRLRVCSSVRVCMYAPACWFWSQSHKRCPPGPDWHRGQIPLWWVALCEEATGPRGQTGQTRQHLTPDPHGAAHLSAEEEEKRQM